MVQPEGHPRDHHDHEGGEVDGDDVVGYLPLEAHDHRQAAVLACEERIKDIIQIRRERETSIARVLRSMGPTTTTTIVKGLIDLPGCSAGGEP